MNFVLVFLKTIGKVVWAGSCERAYKKARVLDLPPRNLQLWLALSSLAFSSSIFIYFMAPFSGPLLSLFSFLSRGEEPSEWVFWLGENSWLGLAIGLLVGALLRGILRFSGFYFFVSAGLLLSGIASLSTAWGIFLGGFLFGSFENFWRFSEKEFRLRSAIALAFGLGGLILAPMIQIWFSNLNWGSYSGQLRWFQWILLVSSFLVSETVTSLIFFHFYYAQNQKLTKV